MKIKMDKRVVFGKVGTMAVLAFLLCGCSFLGYSYGYLDGTGTMPFGVKSQSILPPGIEATTFAEVSEFVEASDTDFNKYDVGFNCVEYTLLQARDAHWQGIPAVVIRLDFEDEGSHLMLGFPTDDEGWKFLDPQGKVWVKPSVGGMFLDSKIAGVFYLSEFVWLPVEETK